MSTQQDDRFAGWRWGHPPLWTVPLLLVAVVAVLFHALAVSLGFLGVVLAGVGLIWLLPRVDAYVRWRERDL